MEETQLSFVWYQDKEPNIRLEIPCTIPLNKGDRYVHSYNNELRFLEVDFRLFNETTNSLIIVFKETN